METALYSVAQIRAVEQAARAGLPAHALMARAGAAAASAALRLLGAGPVEREDSRSALPVLIAAGPGNNGGDAFECAVHLMRAGCAVTILVPSDPDTPGADRIQAQAKARAAGAVFADPNALPALAAQAWALVIEGLFGIGITRPLAGVWPAVIRMLNEIDAPLLALDVPGGLDADTGMAPAGAGGARVCIRASHTLTFIGNKAGLHTGDGRDQAGMVTVASLDIDPALFPAPCAHLNGPARFPDACRTRRQNTHKGSFGEVRIIGGAPGMAGAAVLAAHAALKTGCGRILVGFADAGDIPTFVPGHPELMCRAAAVPDPASGVLVVGPGLGAAQAARDLVAAACASDAPLVLDADGLNLVAGADDLRVLLKARGVRQLSTVLTPHPLEAARLLGMATAAVQADRLHAAALLAERFAATVVLKGSGSIIAHGGRLLVNPTGNPALASGGTGDVLAGICGALLAQGCAPDQAAAAAVWIHGAAADRLVTQGIGPVGLTATEIIDAARAVLNALSPARGPAPAL